MLALTSQTDELQKVLNLVWEHLLPALGTGSPGATSTPTDVGLAARLTSLTLPAARGGRLPAGLTSQGFVMEKENDQPDLTEVFLQDRLDQEWTITFREGGWRMVAALGMGQWITTGDVAISGVLDPTRVSFGCGERTYRKILFLYAPHRLQLVCQPNAGTFQSR